MMDRRQIDWPMFWLANGRPRSATRRDASRVEMNATHVQSRLTNLLSCPLGTDATLTPVLSSE